MLDEQIAALALANKEKLLERNIALIRENLRILLDWAAEDPHFSLLPPKPVPPLWFSTISRRNRWIFAAVCWSKPCSGGSGRLFWAKKELRIGYACAADVLREGLRLLSLTPGQFKAA